MKKMLLSLSDADVSRIDRRSERDGLTKSAAVRSLLSDGLRISPLPSLDELDAKISELNALLGSVDA